MVTFTKIKGAYHLSGRTDRLDGSICKQYAVIFFKLAFQIGQVVLDSRHRAHVGGLVERCILYKFKLTSLAGPGQF